MLGEHGQLVAGGLLDQPAGLLLAVNRARWINSLLDDESREGFDLMSVKDAADKQKIIELRALRKQIQDEQLRK